MLALGTSTGIYVYRVEGFEQVWRRFTRHPIEGVAWSPDGERLLAWDDFYYSGVVVIWDAVSGARIHDLEPSFNEAVWSPDGSLIAINTGFSSPYGQMGGVQLYEGRSGLPIRKLEVAGDNWTTNDWPETFVTQITWSSDGQRLAAKTIDDTIYLWDTGSGELLSSFVIPNGRDSYEELAFDPESNLLVAMITHVSASDKDLSIWDVESSKRILEILMAPLGFPMSWSPDGRQLAERWS
jgi:WD40 repeat protein